jgi:hypothetical protein
MSDKKSTLKLNTKKHTGFGIASLSLSLASVILFIIAVNISAFWDRNLTSIQIRIGIIEILAILCCLIGIIYALMGLAEKDKYKTYGIMGLGINIVIGIFHIVVLANGF